MPDVVIIYAITYAKHLAVSTLVYLLFADDKGGPIWGPLPRDLFLGRWVPVKASYKASSSYKVNEHSASCT